jgi:hypothetical protein
MQNLLPHDKTRFEQNTYTHDITQQLITSVFFYSRDPFGPNSKAHTAGIPRDDNESHWLDRERGEALTTSQRSWLTLSFFRWR